MFPFHQPLFRFRRLPGLKWTLILLMALNCPHLLGFTTNQTVAIRFEDGSTACQFISEQIRSETNRTGIPETNRWYLQGDAGSFYLGRAGDGTPVNALQTVTLPLPADLAWFPMSARVAIAEAKAVYQVQPECLDGQRWFPGSIQTPLGPITAYPSGPSKTFFLMQLKVQAPDGIHYGWAAFTGAPPYDPNPSPPFPQPSRCHSLAEGYFILHAAAFAPASAPPPVPGQFPVSVTRVGNAIRMSWKNLQATQVSVLLGRTLGADLFWYTLGTNLRADNSAPPAQFAPTGSIDIPISDREVYLKLTDPYGLP